MPGQMVGKSEYLHAVHVDDATAAIGQTARVRITGSRTNSLSGIMA
jgi:tRNA-2-methylthio-N6-dimethylallyladenosine synthase